MATYSRPTEIMPVNSAGITLRMDGDSSRPTEFMSFQKPQIPAALSVGSEIDGYLVESVIAENTGEATLLSVSKSVNKFVMKIYHSDKRPKKELSESVRRIESEYVIKALADGEYSGRYYEILPFFKNRDLASNIPISFEELETVVIPCANEGLFALHSVGIVHRDIKPGNIFFSDDRKKAVIGDFGISSLVGSGMSVRATGMSRTLGYAAPETSSGFISKESDYYSLGIALLHLAIGQDPFLGMTEMQILYQTINRKIDIPQSVSPRLSKLIKGLTSKDREDRWGYEEVCRWIKKEPVALAEKSGASAYAYEFMGDEYSDLKELSLALAGNWENAKRELYSGLLSKKLFVFGEKISENCSRTELYADKDVGTFRLIYTLNPTAPLCYKGEMYGNIETLGKKLYSMLPAQDENALELLMNGCLSYYLDLNGYESDVMTKTEDIAESIRDGNDDGYYSLIYLFNPDCEYSIDDYSCKNLNELVVYLEKLSSDEREKICRRLEDDGQFLMWTASQGFELQVSEWKKLYENAEW